MKILKLVLSLAFTLAFVTLIKGNENSLVPSSMAESDWETHLKLARILRYDMQYEESLAEYRKVLKIKPSFSQAKIEMATIYFIQKNYSESLNLLGQLEHEELTLEAILLITQIYAIEGKYQQAETLYKTVLNINPKQRDLILRKLAQLYSWQQRFDESIAIYKELVNKPNPLLKIIHEYAQVLSYAKEYDKALEEYQKILKIDSSHSNIKVEMATLYFYQKKYSEAFQLLSQIPTQELTVDMILLLAEVYIAEENYKLAEEIYKNIMIIKPDQKRHVQEKLANLLSWQKRYEESLTIFKELVALPNPSLELRQTYALTLSYAKYYDEALEEFQKIQEENPHNPKIKVEIAKIYFYQKEYAESFQVLENLSQEERSAEGELLLANIYIMQKKYDKAEEIYKHLLPTLTKEKDLVLFKLAELLSWQKKYKESLTIYKELVKKHPNDRQLKRKYGYVLHWSGDNKEAAKILESTLR